MSESASLPGGLTLAAILAFLKTIEGTPEYQTVVSSLLLPYEASVEAKVTNPFELSLVKSAFGVVNNVIGLTPTTS